MTFLSPFIPLIRQWIFWMLFFAAQRAIFLIYYFTEVKLAGAGSRDMWLTFYHAFKLDNSTVCYLLILPFLLLLFHYITSRKLWSRINLGYSLFILTISLLITTGEIGIYKEWNTKLSYKALVYLQNPAEVVSSVKTSDLLVYILFILIQLGIFGYLYWRNIQKKIFIQPTNLGVVIFGLLTPVLLFIGIRGGFGQIPITSSQSYFSRYDILNLAAVNPAYNIAFSSLDYIRVESANHFHFMPHNEAVQIVERLHAVEKDTTRRILNLDRPNIMVIFLESWSGDLIESLGGRPGLTPQFRMLEDDGILFTNFFASGNRSQQSLASLFSGFPAIPVTTLTDHPQKYASVPSLIRMLKAEGYFTSFYFGGDLNYGNIRSYLVYNGFDRLVGEDDFPAEAPRGKLGFHDESLYAKMAHEMARQPRPFFTSALTLSSHSPYDQPGPRPLSDIEFAGEYVNSAWYADKCLGEFMREINDMPWYDSTLVIIMSDHSHVSYNNYQWWSFDYRRIPLLITGGALEQEYRGTVSERIAANMDVTATLLRQLEMEDSGFFWSKNMFNPYVPQFAYFELNDGFGWKTPAGRLEYNTRVPLVLSTDLNKDDIPVLRREGEAYIQVLFREFLDY